MFINNIAYNVRTYYVIYIQKLNELCIVLTLD